ncbi:MAG: TlpA disulfide reductase family protein, partial [Eubacteriales bacterium]
LGVAFPSDESQYTQEGSKQDVIDFLATNGYTYPTLMDMNGDLLFGYGISSFPTTFMIDQHGNVFGYVPGMMTYDIMTSIIAQTIAGT